MVKKLNSLGQKLDSVRKSTEGLDSALPQFRAGGNGGADKDGGGQLQFKNTSSLEKKY